MPATPICSRLGWIVAVIALVWAGPAGANEVLSQSLRHLNDHLTDRKTLAPDELLKLETLISENGKGLHTDTLKQAFAVVARYDQTQGPLFINAQTRNTFKRTRTQGIELDRALFALQQALLDHAYTPDQVAQNPALYRFKFGTADYFPGPCEPSKTPRRSLTTRVNATQIPGQGFPLNEDGSSARRPTGWYLPAGEVAVIQVPEHLVNKGYRIRVGAHAWDLEKRPIVARLDRVSLIFPITSQQVTIAHPLGGGVYLEVPWEAQGGIVELQAKNLVPSGFFSRRSFDLMDDADWNQQRAHQAPWVDFETDTFMMQIPRLWAQQIDDPVALMGEYDKCMDLYSEITGRPKVRSKSVLYFQVDVVFRGNAFFPGYPQSNFNWKPHRPEIRNGQRWIIQGPHKAPSVLFHEMGHGHRITKFPGGTEAVVNFPYVYVQNVGYGVELNQAFSKSMGILDGISIDQAAISRMVSETFRNGQPANTSNRPGDEVKYQHRGYAVYADIADLFGWEPLTSFWTQDQANYLAGEGAPFASGRTFPRKNINKDPVDNRILRLSIHAGVDLRPLCHFWGRHPQNPAKLSSALLRHGLKPSAAIYDKLEHYRSIIPMNRSDFLAHAKVMHPRVGKPGRNANETNPLFGMGWYNAWVDQYSPEHAAKAQAALNSILETYYPQGRPQSD